MVCWEWFGNFARSSSFGQMSMLVCKELSVLQLTIPIVLSGEHKEQIKMSSFRGWNEGLKDWGTCLAYTGH